MAVENQKRFRKRGGAKKKKKKAQELDSSSQTKDISETTAPTFRAEGENAVAPDYFSGFTPAHGSQSRLCQNVDPDIHSYLEKLQAQLEEVDPGATAALAYDPSGEDPPDSVLLSRNALAELSPRLAELSRDNQAARFLEVLFRTTKSIEVLSKALDALLSVGAHQVAEIAAHRCASHVLQTLLVCLRDMGDKLEPLIPLVSNWTSDDIMNLIASPSGTHVLRVILAALSGLPNEEPRESKLEDSDPRKIKTYLDDREFVSDESLAAVAKVANTVLSTNVNIHDMLWESSSSAVLQALLSAVTVADKNIAARLGEECLKAGFSNLVNDSCGSRFVERLILCLGTFMVEKHVKGHLAELAKHPKGNFALQRYLLALKGRGAVMSAWDELEESIQSMLGLGKVREGVVLALLRVTETQGDENCRRRASRAVARACGAVGSRAKSLSGILAMGSEEVWERWRENVKELGLVGMGIYGRSGDVLRIRGRLMKASLLGTLIARCVMRFPGGPGQATRDSMAALSNLEMLALIADPCGSRLVEQWIEDERIERSMKIAANLLKTIWESGEAAAVLSVARNPYGAMVIVRCSPLLKGPQRKQLMDTLASDFENLRKHESGQIVTRKCRVEHYMRKGEEWEQEEATKQTRQRLFAEILEDESDGENTSKLEEKTRMKRKDAKSSKRRKRAVFKDVDMPDNGRDAVPNKNLGENVAQKVEAGNSGSLGKDDNESNETTLASVLNAIESVAKPSEKRKKKKRKRHEDD